MNFNIAVHRLQMYYSFTLEDAAEEVRTALRLDLREYFSHSRMGKKPLHRRGRKAVWDWARGIC